MKDPKSQEELLDKKRKRQERNRESARECRKRKKERKTVLTEQLARLEADNLRLRLQLQIGKNSSDIEEKAAHVLSKLEGLIKEQASEVEIKTALSELSSQFADYGRDRKSAIEFHINQLRKSLEPTQTTRCMLWLMNLSRKFHEPNGDIKPVIPGDELSEMWIDLLDSVKPSTEQRKAMMGFTAPAEMPDPFVEVRDVTNTCSTMVDRLTEIIGSKNESLDTEMENIQSILSSTQIAKFVLWIDQNPACLQMLESLWPHLTYKSGDEGSDEEDEDEDSFVVPSAASVKSSDSKSGHSIGKVADDSDSFANHDPSDKGLHASVSASIPMPLSMKPTSTANTLLLPNALPSQALPVPTMIKEVKTDLSAHI